MKRMYKLKIEVVFKLQGDNHTTFTDRLSDLEDGFWVDANADMVGDANVNERESVHYIMPHHIVSITNRDSR